MRSTPLCRWYAVSGRRHSSCGGTVDPVRDIETVSTELVLADLETAETQGTTRQRRQTRRQSWVAELAVLVEPHLDSGKLAVVLELTRRTRLATSLFCSLTSPPSSPQRDRIWRRQTPILRAKGSGCTGTPACETVVISAQIESDLVDLEADGQSFLEELGVQKVAWTIDSGNLCLAGVANRLLPEKRRFVPDHPQATPQGGRSDSLGFRLEFIKAETVAHKALLSADRWRLHGKKGCIGWKGRSTW